MYISDLTGNTMNEEITQIGYADSVGNAIMIYTSLEGIIIEKEHLNILKK